MLEYTRMNVHRMNRLDKTELTPSLVSVLKSYPRNLTWLVITEAWCGDAAQNIPQLALMADAAPNIELKLILRDEQLDVMDQYLTNGARSIPKMVVLETESLKELATWGPRPAEAQKLLAEWKANPTVPKEQFLADMQKWYAKDKSLSLMAELEALLTQLA